MSKKVVIFGDDPRGFTGLGRITRHLMVALLQEGFEPVAATFKTVVNEDVAEELNNKSASSIECNWENAPTYSVDGDSEKGLETVLEKENASMVISVCDPWDLQGLVEVKKRRPFVWIAYLPVESIPYSRYILLVRNPPHYLDTAYILSFADRLLTYSDFGRDAVRKMLKDAGSSSQGVIEHIYLGVDNDYYCPLDKPAGSSTQGDSGDKNQEKITARKIFGGAVKDDAVLFTCIKVNSIRAGFDSLLESWALYLEKAKKVAPDIAERSVLYLHTSIQGPGYPVPVIMQRYGLESSLLLNPQLGQGRGVSEAEMLLIYQSTDIGISAARGEGFGFNILEALSCGVPCIVPDYGCPSEYGGDGVMRVPVAACFNPDFATTDFAIIDTAKMSEVMLELAIEREKQETMGIAGREVALGLSWKRFHEQWIRTIKAEYESRPELSGRIEVKVN